mgnify:CR=1 FL=1
MSLNTLSGGHPLRTRSVDHHPTCTYVSIPSQAGTLFGHEWHGSEECKVTSLNTLSGGHPLRTLEPELEELDPDSLNTLSGGHPLRTCTDYDIWWWQHRLNTLSGGHPLRTGEGVIIKAGACMSQYPLRRAPSSDLIN